MAVFQQQLSKSRLGPVSTETKTALSALPEARFRASGASVAVCVGSRNIDQLSTVVRATIDFLKMRGFSPFIVPAMGSHGGATPEGQTRLLRTFGITPQIVGAPVHADIQTRIVDALPDGMPLHVSASALLADHIVLINRIKPHTKFKADIQSGLCKMLTIGLGKDKGAGTFHRYGVSLGFSLIETAAERLLEKLPLLFGIGLIEDGYGKLAQIDAILPEELVEREKLLLLAAADRMGRIPFDQIDILIVDRIGKDISGIGMDSNVTGRHRDIVGDFYGPPNPARIFVRDLSPKSDGNANGIGLADVTTKRLVSRLDKEKTFVNAITAISPEKAAIPIHFESDRECIAACVHTAGITDAETARIVRIRDTASLEYIEVSRTLDGERQSKADIEQITPWSRWQFDENENLLEFYPNS